MATSINPENLEIDAPVDQDDTVVGPLRRPLNMTAVRDKATRTSRRC